MKNLKIYPLFFLAITTLMLSSCGDDDPIIEDPVEVITTLTYVLVPNGGGDNVTLNFQDLDGDGGNAPTITGGTLQANTTYTGTLTLLNESESPADNITAEIMDEDEEHQFFFTASANAPYAVTYNDTDADGNPVGLSSTLTTQDAGNGTLTITLRHKPNKTASGVADGDLTNAGGETDIEVSFSVDVQ